MFSHLSLRPSSGNNQTPPSVFEELGEKAFGNAGETLDRLMAESKDGSQLRYRRSKIQDLENAPCGGLAPKVEKTDKTVKTRASKVQPASDKELGTVRGFDPTTGVGIIWAGEDTVPFDTKGMSAELVAALRAGDRAVEVVFRVVRVNGQWTASDMEEVGPAVLLSLETRENYI